MQNISLLIINFHLSLHAFIQLTVQLPFTMVGAKRINHNSTINRIKLARNGGKEDRR